MREIDLDGTLFRSDKKLRNIPVCFLSGMSLKRFVKNSMNGSPEVTEEKMSILFVALGGALGAAGRYAISLIPIKTEFPVLTLLTNIIGAILIGFIVGAVSHNSNASDSAVLFWKTGVCGGFTTFSTFSLEVFSLFEKKSYVLGSVYIVLSVSFCVLGVLLGKRIAVLLLG